MSRPVRILHLRGSNFVGGPERQLFQYAEAERETEGLEIILGVFVDRFEGHQFADEIMKRGLRPATFPAGSYRALHALVQYLQEEQIDLLCTHGYKADVIGTFAARAARVPIAPFLRGWTGEDWKVRAYESLNRRILRSANRVVCLSRAQAERIRAELDLEQLAVVVNATAPAPGDRAEARRKLNERFGIPADSLIVASAGRLSPEKGTADFLKAAANVHQKSPSTHFIVFGDGRLRQELEAAASRQWLSGVCHFAGHIPEFPSLLPGIDLLVNPSHTEEMPNVVLEAMARSVPVVATGVGAVREIAGEPAAIRLVAACNVRAMTTAISELLADGAAREGLGSAGKERVASAYSPAAQAAQLRSLYLTLVPRVGEVFGPEPQFGADLPVISIVIPVRNEEQHIVGVLEGLSEQQYPREKLEVIVVDGDSTDKTAEVVERYAKTAPVSVRVVPNPKRWSSAGRNAGTLASRGEIIAYIDGHCGIPSQRLLWHMARTVREHGVDALSRAAIFSGAGYTLMQNVIAHARDTIIAHGPGSTIYRPDLEALVDPMSAGFAYTRHALREVGLHDERFDACEDVEINYRIKRAGLNCMTSPALTIQYVPRTSLGGLWRQMNRYGRGRARLAIKHPEAVTLGQLVPAGFVLALILGALAALALPVIGKLTVGLALSYLTVVFLFSAWLGLQYDVYHFFTAPTVYLVVHFGLGLGYWQELLLYAAGRSALRAPLCQPELKDETAPGVDESRREVVEVVELRPSLER